MAVGGSAFAGRTVRSNPRYVFRPASSLSSSELAFLESTVDKGDFSGILVDSTELGLSIKVVSAQTAALFERFSGECRIDSLNGRPDAVDYDDLAHLTLEGVLEISHAGKFVSGASAISLFIEDFSDVMGRGRLGHLSQSALIYADQLAIVDPATLASRLYFYNRVPLSGHWLSQWPHLGAVLDFLGIQNGATARPISFHDEFIADQIDERSPWISWRRRSSIPAFSNPNAALFKLYVSPAPEQLRSAFDSIIQCLPSSDVLSFKIGATATGLLRPDKAVVYFDSYPGLSAFAKKLLPLTSHLRSHGVPFTAQLDESGLLSWGIDPKRSDTRLDENSWRKWICSRLASYIVEAKSNTEGAVRPWEYAVARAWVSGVDTQKWQLKLAEP